MLLLFYVLGVEFVVYVSGLLCVCVLCVVRVGFMMVCLFVVCVLCLLLLLFVVSRVFVVVLFSCVFVCDVLVAFQTTKTKTT